MADTVYSLTTKHLTEIDDTTAIELFRKLLLAETWRFGIPQSRVHVSSAINVADGGIDASIEELEPGIHGNVFFPGQTRYQIKTGESFTPWRESHLKKELFGSSKKSIIRTNLAPSVRECLAANGTYILVCFGLDIVDQNRVKAKLTLEKLLEQCRFKSPRTDVWGAAELRTAFEIYPPLTLEIAKRQDRFLSHTVWSSTSEMQRSLQHSTSRELLVEQIQRSLRADESTQIRVYGEPGVGKTRIVLEPTRSDDLAPVVAYWDKAENFLESQQFHDIRSGHAQYSALLVVDECDFEHSSRIWDVLKARPRSMSRIRLVTIHHELEVAPTSPDICPIDIKRLGEKDIEAILESHGVPQDFARHYSGLCSGSPRVAHIVGENLKEYAPKLTGPRTTMGEVWTRYICGRHGRDSEIARRTKTILGYLSLFKKFGLRPPVNHEGDFIFKLVNESDPSIGRSQFDETVYELRNRRILQGETTLYITPKLFHIWLWEQWWETHGHSLTVLTFLKTLPPALFDWFGQMFRYAQDSKAATDQVKYLLGPEGPFADGGFIESDLGGRFFFSLAEASPSDALACLERIIGNWDQVRLGNFIRGRHEVVFALQRLVFYPHLFTRAASLLLALAEAENEQWGNSATSVFQGLFTLVGGSIAPTAASPSERFPILEGALNSASKRRRAIGLEACKEALDQHPRLVAVRSRTYGAQQQPEGWRPKTYQELLDAVRFVWKLLESKARSLPDTDERERAETILIEQGIGFLDETLLSDMVFDTLERCRRSSPSIVKTLTKTLLLTTRYYAGNLSEPVRHRLIALRDKLSGKTFASTLRRYTGIVDWDSLAEDEGSRITEKLKKLARRAVASRETFINELAWLTSPDAENAFPFGVEVGEVDSEHTLLPSILDAYRSPPAQRFVGLLSGYLKAVYETSRDFWEQTLDLMASDEGLAPWVPEVTWRSGITERAGQRVLELASRGVIGPGHFRFWSFGTDIRKLSPLLLCQWLNYLLKHEEPTARPLALELFYRYYSDGEVQASMPLDLAKKLLLHPDFFKYRQHGGMHDYYWAETSQRLIAQEPKAGISLLDGVLSQWTTYDASFGITPNRAASVLYRIVKDQPTEAWQAMAKLLDDLRSVRSWLIMEWLQGHSPVAEMQSINAMAFLKLSDVAKWVNKSRKSRARFLARHVPKSLEGESGQFTREFVARYGGDPEVRNSLIANLSSESFYGPASTHYQETKDRMATFRRGEENRNLQTFLDEYIEVLSERVAQERIREERSHD